MYNSDATSVRVTRLDYVGIRTIIQVLVHFLEKKIVPPDFFFAVLSVPASVRYDNSMTIVNPK